LADELRIESRLRSRSARIMPRGDAMQDTIESPDELPSGAAEIARAYPAIWRAFAGLGKACGEAGPLDRRTIRLVKLALSLGALSEGAVHSHTRRALAQGLSPDE